MSKAKVLVTSPSVPRLAIDLLKNKFDVVVSDEAKPSRETIKKLIKGVDGVFWSSFVRVDSEMMDAAGPSIKVVATMSVGVDHIDLAECKKRNIKVGYTPNVLNETVAETAILLALAAGRRLHEGRLHIQNGTWAGGVDWMLGQDLYGSVCGIVGFGRIGQAIAQRLKCFSVKRILYSSRTKKAKGDELGAEFVANKELLTSSDFVFAACALTPETTHLFNRESFSLMKSSSVFVNISRGLVVDQEALIDALETKKIFAAGLDVMTPEPLPTDSKLLQLKNCVLMPHLGSATNRTRDLMGTVTAQNIIAALENASMPFQYPL